jgi:multidrug efflux pump subunit AcrB
MWIVRLAIRRPYTFVVASILIMILGTVAIVRTPVDIFPNIDIPVVSVIWNYGGFSPEDMANRIMTVFERMQTQTVDNIEHTESQSLNGIAVEKIFFQPGVSLSLALSQVTSIAQNITRQMPVGTTPPQIIVFNASTVPILQLALSSPSLSEQQLSDAGGNFVRPQLVTVPGAAIPGPYGGKNRTVIIDLNLQALQAKGLAPVDVANTIASQSLILPSGTAKIGAFEYHVDMNAFPATINGLNAMPVRTINGTTVYVRDVGNVRDGFNPQTNIARVNGQRSVLQTILKNGSYSTLDIIRNIKAQLPLIEARIPYQGVSIYPVSDQSLFVLASIKGVVREGVIAACLTGFMILVFLGTWRSTIIIAVSIPLSILASLIALSALGETINIMTLGGLALAVGILVDDATVTMENIHRNVDQGKEIIQAIMDGAEQIAVPALVSTLSICIVFVPMFFLSGVPRYLFAPLAEAVVFAMLASYLLSRTLVPTMARYLLLPQTEEERKEATTRSRNPFVRMQAKFEEGFEKLREGYHGLLQGAVKHRNVFTVGFLALCVLSFGLLPVVGQDFFPRVDNGEFRFHVRAPIGTRIEETANLCDQIDNDIRAFIPANQLGTITDNIGLPYSGTNLSYSTSAPIGPGDADIQVELAGDHAPTMDYIRALRRKLLQDFPGVTLYELPVDIVTQVLNFGLPAPIDVQVIGPNLLANHVFASNLLNKLKFVPGIVDLRIQQPLNYPKLHIDVDRTKASEVGLTQKDVANNLLLSLSGSGQVAPTFWLDPTTGVSYSLSMVAPQYRIESLQDLRNIPVTGTVGGPPQIMAGLASFSRSGDMGVVSHYNIQPTIDIYGAVDGRDLGSVAREIDPILKESQKDLPRGAQVLERGQIQTMNASFGGLLGGLAFSIVLVYLLIVVNFQSWLDPFIILMALPAALAGIVWFLFATGTTISVPALTGAIMCMGVATANSILVVSFSKERLEAGKTPAEAALEAGYTRFRPVLMTALAMIIGMLPMSLGLGEGGEQNAPLGRAVIGGLLFATIATLFFVPVFFSVVHKQRGTDQAQAALD